MKDQLELQRGFKGEEIIVIPRETLRSFKLDAFNKNLYLTDIGYFPKASFHFRKRPEGCPEYILIYCVEGFGYINVNQKKYELCPNTFFIIEAEKSHYYFSDKKDPWSIYWIHFEGEFAKPIFDKFNSLQDGNQVAVPFEKNRISELEYIIDVLRTGISKELFEYSNMLLYKTIGSLLFYSLKSNKKNETENDKLVEDIKVYLKNNLSETITISEIAQKFNRSTSGIFSLFKQKTGYSIIHYFNLIKVQSACELINLSTMTIKEISYHLNFQDPLYFSRLFKKYMGISPREYRNNL
ncbi:AraC family transcriptional regulator [Belliella marina]|uniref:AraC family transcriptional regulator n=1 Tax=Belliella marina TaxID=1644146 RepID=A0ABW4VQG2_9BACT